MTQTKEQAQIQLQNALTTTFLANLAFLSEYDNELYHRVDELSRMIESGKYEEKYALEFIMEDGDFDIYDIVNNKYLYDRNPKKRNDELVRKVDFDEKNSILNLEEIFSYKEIFDVKEENRFNFNTLESIAFTSNKMQEYKTITKDFLETKKKRLKEVKKFIFLGTLLGRHIPKIAQKVDAEIYLVLEKNLEIFRLSLFTVDYTVLAKKGVIFSIMDNISDEERKIELFLDILKYDNYLIKFSTTGINIDDYISKLLGIISSNKPTIYDYNRKLYIHLNRTIQRINDAYNFPQFNKFENAEFFKNIPILYIAAGPSLDENIDWIKNNQDKFFITCVGSALKKLLDNNIRVDIICSVDEDIILEELQFNNEIIKRIPSHTLLFASSITNEIILKKFNKDRVFIFEVYRTLFKNNFAFNGYSVGELALHILLKLNAKEIYLVGFDLTINQNTGETHSKDSGSTAKIMDIENTLDERDIFGLNNSLIKVKGNKKNEVVTSALFYASINFLNQKILTTKKNDINIYNLSNDGAFFENTIPLDIVDINNLATLSIEYSEFKNFLTKNCLNSFEDDIKKLLNTDINKLKEIIENNLKDLEKLELINLEDFIKKYFDEISNKLNSLNNQLLYVILDKYYLIVISYIKYHFNNTKIKDEKKKINKIGKLFLSQLTYILNDYIKIVSDAIKKEGI